MSSPSGIVEGSLDKIEKKFDWVRYFSEEDELFYSQSNLYDFFSLLD
jgi:hypothetical protein